MTFVVSSGGSHGIAGTPGFQGYLIVQCDFRYAHGFAFITDGPVGSARVAEGYLGLVMDADTHTRQLERDAAPLALRTRENASVTIASMFHIRCIFPEQGRIEANSFELQPTNPQGEAVCELFHRFLADRPDRISGAAAISSKGRYRTDWSAAAGGVALASLFCSGDPAAISVLLSGIDAEADAMMRRSFPGKRPGRPVFRPV